MAGRVHSLTESVSIDNRIVRFLDEHDITYLVYDDFGKDRIISLILRQIGKSKTSWQGKLVETDKQKTLIDFPCPYTLEQRYEMVCSGEYGVFEMFDSCGNVSGYRGFRSGYGSTGVYDNYRSALEAAFTEFGDK